MKPTVLILGARGRFGMAAARAFSEAGWKVLGQIRPGASARLSGVQWLPIDLKDGAALAQAARGASVVVHALNPPYPQWAKQVPVLMETAIDVAKALDATLMFTGDVYNYGASMPARLDEETPDLARSFVAVADKLAQEPSALPRHASFCFAGHQLTGNDWAQLLQTVARDKGWLAAGQALKIGAMPWWLIKSLSFAVPMFRELLEMRYLWHTPYALSGDKLAAFIGAQPVTPLPQALRAALADLGK